MKLIVLMSTYNGEKYLRQQLDSLLNQKLMPNKIVIRDDGSTDNTLDIIDEYEQHYSFIEHYQGQNKGPAKSFFELINNCEDADYYALCDQDDVWFEDKLSSAIEQLNKEDNNKPLLYCCRYTLTDENLNPIETNISSLYSYTDFAHSLLYQTSPGCTFVFNHEARKRVMEYDIENNYCMIHDSIIHKIVTMFGKMILDEKSHIYYRQHGDNEIGLSGNKIKAFTNRIEHFTSGKSRSTRSNMAKSLLKVFGTKCSIENKELMDIVANYQDNSVLKKQLLTNPKFKVDSLNYFFYKILVLVNYI
ncbi:MAG: glycosyltransferase family 2 protein [Erysipelotrichaceae bacterium]|nr:glycosyltransferase family 2 protein [Erysipelotrichaceae bacterium]